MYVFLGENLNASSVFNMWSNNVRQGMGLALAYGIYVRVVGTNNKGMMLNA
jgi:hypothetical protein